MAWVLRLRAGFVLLAVVLGCRPALGESVCVSVCGKLAWSQVLPRVG
jgi:hypothetical protein